MCIQRDQSSAVRTRIYSWCLVTCRQGKETNGMSDIINHFTVFISLLHKRMTLIGNVLQNTGVNHLQKYKLEEQFYSPSFTTQL